MWANRSPGWAARRSWPAYRAVAGDLRLTYSQFQELEAFSRFGTRLDERTRKTLEHGYRVREVLKQAQFDPMPVAHQIAVLLAVTQGLLDDIPLDRVPAVEKAVRRMLCEQLPEVCRRIEAGEDISAMRSGSCILGKIKEVVQSSLEAGHGNH